MTRGSSNSKIARPWNSERKFDKPDREIVIKRSSFKLWLGRLPNAVKERPRKSDKSVHWTLKNESPRNSDETIRGNLNKDRPWNSMSDRFIQCVSNMMTPILTRNSLKINSTPSVRRRFHALKGRFHAMRRRYVGVFTQWGGTFHFQRISGQNGCHQIWDAL